MSKKQLIISLLLTFFAINSIKSNENEDLDAHFKLASNYLYINEDSALYFCNLAYNLAVQNNDAIKEAQVLLIKGEILRYKGEAESVIHICNTVREIAQNTGDRSILAANHILKAKTYIDLNIYDKAYSYVGSAYKIYKDLNDSTGLACVFNEYGVLSDLEFSLDEAIKYYNEALIYAKNSNDKLIKIRIKNNLSVVYYTTGNLNRSKNLLFQCVREIESNNIAFGLDRLYMNFAPIYVATNQVDSALYYVDLSLDIAYKNKNNASIARSLIYKGAVLFYSEKFDKAIIYFNKADSISTLLSFDHLRPIALDYLAKMYEQKGDYKKAYLYLSDFKYAVDSLHTKQNFNNLTRLKIKNSIDIDQINESHNKEKTQLILVFLAIIILITCACIFSIVLYSKEKKIRSKQERILKYELEQSNKEITTKNIYLHQKNAVLADIAQKLDESRHKFKTQNQPIIQDAINLLNNTSKGGPWEEFEMRFELVHSAFFQNLNKKCPNLTQNEKRLCAYLRLNMTTKEIAVLTRGNLRTIEQSRYRLRKKMNIPVNIDLVAFMEGIC